MSGSDSPATQPGSTAGAPLAGIRVIALEQAVAAPFCTRHLADLGADVIKIERPDGGDFARHYDSVVNGQSAYFVWLNRGKRSVALDLATPAGLAAFVRLIGSADVFVHNLGPGALDRLGLGSTIVAARWPRLISCGISGYGVDGPDAQRKGFDLLLQGESGLMATTGTPAEPAKVGISIADISGGMYALASILAALRQRDVAGVGATIEISILDCLAEWMMVPMYYAMYAGAAPPRSGQRHASIVPYGPYATADGSVNLAVQTQAQWGRLCADVLELPQLVDHPDFATNELRVANRAVLEVRIQEVLGQLPLLTVEDRLVQADVPFGRLNDVAGLVEHPQLRERNRWFEVDAEGGAVRAVVPPFGLTGLPVRRDGIPFLGEHTAEVLAEVEDA